jgi:hypothetical protein
MPSLLKMYEKREAELTSPAYGSRRINEMIRI